MVTHGYSRVRTLLRVQLPRCKACAHMRVARPRSRQAPCVPSARLANETGLTPPTSARECAHADGPAAVDKAPAAYRRRGRRRCTGARRLCLPPRVGPARRAVARSSHGLLRYANHWCGPALHGLRNQASLFAATSSGGSSSAMP
jgi:hypothetical protein